MSLSPRQQHILQVIKDFAARGYSPRYEEIGAAVGIRSTNGVRHHLKALTIKGYLRPKLKGMHRSIVLATPQKPAA